MRFMVHKGHDGPARNGHLENEISELELPTLLDLHHSHYVGITYSGSARSDDADRWSLFDTGSLLEDRLLSDLKMEPRTLYLLPSLIGISSLSSDTGIQYVRAQLDLLTSRDLDPSQCIVRIPSSIESIDLVDMLRESEILGAAFGFNGDLGKSDLGNLRIRSSLPRNLLCIALGRIPPYLVSTLYYLGFDIIDSAYAHQAAGQGIRLWSMDSEELGTTPSRRVCSCIHCTSDAGDSSLGKNEIASHNSAIYAQELSSAVVASQNGTLRWLVESRSHASPSMASFLRLVDRELYPFIEEFSPIHVDAVTRFIGSESYHSPIARRYREYLAERYTPPVEKKVVLLLPCSARKPYSDSQSHRRFSRVLDEVLGNRRDEVAEVIITSPLGVVPRELERIYPAGYYDIPVTGEWDAEETSIAADALVTHLSKFPESVVIVAHVSGGYLDVVRLAEEKIHQSIIYTSHDASPTSAAALNSLRETLLDLVEMYDLSACNMALLNTIRSTGDFMFGKGAGYLLAPDDASVRGKVYGSVVCRIGKTQTCVFTGNNGRLSLTLEGAKRLLPLERYWVRFNVPELKGSSIFAVGVESADPIIRPGDEVIVIDSSNNVVGVGRSEMSGTEMCEFKNGVAVRLRHKR